jgi:hypothetical protein
MTTPRFLEAKTDTALSVVSDLLSKFRNYPNYFRENLEGVRDVLIQLRTERDEARTEAAEWRDSHWHWGELNSVSIEKFREHRPLPWEQPLPEGE